MKVSFAAAGDESAYLFSGGVHYAADDEARASNGGAAGAFISLLDYAVQCVVRVFNLIPVPPLDGSKILEMVLPRKLAFAFHNFSYRYSFSSFTVPGFQRHDRTDY